ncbi:hypothetical protein [Colwellia sp. 20A7]|jgi:hypothetical protein|uniref:hypothetical protein n=1 Tax=Colwellia sp. 20A7 TaxID=2689569 RepID=UPI0013582704|nr:hypothetical protein [Colwellia sp. 20A7]
MKVNITALLSLFFVVISTNALANQKSDLTDGLSHCMQVSNDQQRLKCFDLLSNKYITPLSSVPESQVKEVVSKVEPIKQEEAKRIDDFAKETLKKPEKDIEGITGTISNLKKLIRGQWVIYLENGQKWQQTDTTSLKLLVGDRINLEKGSFGSVYLSKDGLNRTIRVKRLK